MIKCIIVEDNPMARKSLEILCSKINKLELITSCSTVEDALIVLERDKVNLIFLDIELGNMTGFNLLDQSPVLPEVIVTSNKEEYAFEAFQYEVIDYLKKPIKLQSLKLAVQKVFDKLNMSKSNDKVENIFFRCEGKYVNIKLNEILFIEKFGDYVRINLEVDRYIVHTTLKALILKLPSEKFLKVHRSFIINLEKIIDLEENSILIGKKIIPVSRANKSELMTRINLI